MIVENEKIENLYSGGIKTISMNRINYGNKRLYVSTEPFRVYSGLTGALTAATFKGNVDGKRLDKWRDKMVDSLGRDGQEAYLNSMADFGSVTHEALVRIQRDGKLDWGFEQSYAESYFEASAKANGIQPNSGVIAAQVHSYCKAAASLLQFVFDNVIEMYAIEAMAKSDYLSIATPIDLCCKVKAKGGDKVVTINMKTSNQISDHQREQTAIEKYLWNSTYPDLQAQRTGILRTKDWRKTPSYEYELIDEETEKLMAEDAISRLDLVRKSPSSTYLNYKSSFPVFTGVTLLGEAPKIEYKSLEQIFNEKNVVDIK